MQETVSPFHEKANEAVEDQENKPSFFARLCGGCGTSEEHSDHNPRSLQRNVCSLYILGFKAHS